MAGWKYKPRPKAQVVKRRLANTESRAAKEARFLENLKNEYWSQCPEPPSHNKRIIPHAGLPQLPNERSEYHKAILQREEGYKSNPVFFTLLAAGKA